MKIHFLSNSLRMNSGFGNVTKYLALGLKKLGHDISMTGIQTAYTSDYSYGIEQLPLDVKYIDETTALFLNLKKVDPDVMIYVGQLDADLNHLVRVFDKQIVYCPVEGHNIPDMMVGELKNIVGHGGKVVAQCSYGQSEINKVGIDASMIYHGYNPDIFYPLDTKNNNNDKYESYCYYGTSVGREESDHRLMCIQGCYICQLPGYEQEKCKFFKEETISILRMVNINGEKKWIEKEVDISKLKDETGNGKFVYGFVGINFGIRKRIERLIKAYAILINESRQMKDHTTLHLHCKPIAINGVNLIKEIVRLGISDNVIFSYGTTRSNAWTEQAMARLYNTFDCHVSASSSEGFGMATLESMACGKANIAPNCSSFIELIGDGERGEKDARGLLVLVESWQMVQDGSYRALVSEEHLAVMMKKMYVDKKCRERFEKNAEEWVKTCRWSEICKQWNELLKNY